MRHTAIAAALTLGAVALPSAAWFVAGSRAAEREEAAAVEEPTRRARDSALRLAERLTLRLEELRQGEAQRPFYHYQSLYHDPRGASEGRSVVPSPLAVGPADPLVRAHFQIDSHGRLTLPSLNEEVCDLNLPESVAVNQPILQELQAAARGWWQEMRDRPPGPPSGQFHSKLASSSALPAAPAGQRVEVLDANAWAQNVQAAQLYVDLKSRKLPPPTEVPDQGTVVIQVGDLAWRTISIGADPTLVALREVATPGGPLTQGFQISPQAIARLLEDAPWPATFRPGPAEGVASALVPLGEEPWQVEVDATAARAAALSVSRGIHGDFLRTFTLGALLALVAGAAVVGLVAQSERLARERSRFAAAAAHELRTPLAGLRMYGEMLAEGLGDPARSRDYANRIAEEADRLGRVVSNVMGFTRLERGTLGVRCRPGDVLDVLEPAATRLTPRVAAAGATLELAVGRPVPQVVFDPDALHQIVENLVDNAEKHTRSAEDRTIRITIEAMDGGVEIAVTDHGPGVPSAARNRLFRPFTRIPSPDAPTGLGLGLVMVKALAEAQGAEAGYSAPAEGGARFWVRFPIAQA